jgi:hypothetical protein
MLNVIMLSVVMLNVVMLSVIMLSVMAPYVPLINLLMVKTFSQARNRTGNCGLTYDTLTTWYARQTDLPDDAAFFAAANKSTSNGSSDYNTYGYPSRCQHYKTF